MADRYTMDDAERACERLCKMLGRPYVNRRAPFEQFKKGVWHLDKAMVGNYVRVVEQGVSFSESLVMGGTFYPIKDFCACVSFFTSALSNYYVVRSDGARGYPAGVFELVPQDVDLSLHAIEADTQGWRVVKPLTTFTNQESMLS